MKESFKFRVSYRIRELGQSDARYIEFQYERFRMARKNYKAILLSFYRHKSLDEFQICLNRTVNIPWENPIFHEMDKK